MNVFKVLFICLCVGNIQKHHISAAAAAHLALLFHVSFTLLPKHHESGRGTYMSVHQRVFIVYFTSSWKTKSVLLEPASVSASVIPISLPSVPAYGSPGAKSQEMRYSYHPGGLEKGICFTVAGDGAAEGVTWGWNERQSSTREENCERIAGGFELRLIRSAGRRHRAGVFSHNMSSTVPQIARSAPSLKLTHVLFHDIFKGDIPKCTSTLPVLRVILPDTNMSTDMWSALNNISHSQFVWQARGERGKKSGDPCTIAHYFHQIVCGFMRTSNKSLQTFSITLLSFWNPTVLGIKCSCSDSCAEVNSQHLCFETRGVFRLKKVCSHAGLGATASTTNQSCLTKRWTWFLIILIGLLRVARCAW